jgi:hypothetical protein
MRRLKTLPVFRSIALEHRFARLLRAAHLTINLASLKNASTRSPARRRQCGHAPVRGLQLDSQDLRTGVMSLTRSATAARSRRPDDMWVGAAGGTTSTPVATRRCRVIASVSRHRLRTYVAHPTMK